MKSSLIVLPVGLVGVDEVGEVSGWGFGQKGAAKLVAILSGESIKELEEAIKAMHDKGVSEILCNSARLADAVRKIASKYNMTITIEESPRGEVAELAVKAGLVRTVEEFYERLKDVSLELAEAKVKRAVSRRDKMIVHAVSLLDDLERQINMLYGRLSEWYNINFPELRELIDDAENYASFIHRIGARHKITEDVLRSIVRDEVKAKQILEAALKSLGAEIDEADESKIRDLAGFMLKTIRMKEEVQSYIKSLMEIEAPNISAIAGPTLGARLIMLAGGLEELAKCPASTIQVLGAEKALFRFFRTGRGAPKHGVIFQHPYLHTAPRWQRGKIARALATKISIAAKIDYFSRSDRGAELRKSLEERISEIKEKYKSPPPTRKPIRHKPRRRIRD